MSDQTIAPFIDIAGVRYPLQDGGNVRPWLNYSPTAAFPDTITFGDASKVTDQRTRALVYTDWRGGLGEYQGPNGQLPPQQAFTISDCDTRFERSLVLPPAPTQLGANAALGASGLPWYVEYLGQPNAKLLAWQRLTTTAYRYDPGANAWSGITVGSAGNGATAFVQYGGYYVIPYGINLAGNCLCYSTDGVTWTNGAISTDPLNGRLLGGVEFLNLFWSFQYHSGLQSGVLRWTTDPTTDPFTWTGSSTLRLRPGETVQQLVVWKNPRNEPALHILTSQRLLRYDWDLDTSVTPAFPAIHDFGGRVAATVAPRAYVHPRDQLLYVTLGDPFVTSGPVDSVLQFALGSVDEVGPNKHGGVPNTDTLNLGALIGGYHWLYGFALPRAGTGHPGRVLVMNGLGGWHSIAKGGFGGVNGSITGGGYANGLVWVVTSTGYVYELADPDVPDLPVNLQSGARSYLANTTCWHETSWHGGGMENIRKVLQHLDTDARNADVPGLATNTSLIVQYRLDGSGTWINALNGIANDTTALTSASTFPSVMALAGNLGVVCKRRMKFRLGLASTVSTATPNVAGFEAHFIPKPYEHYAYIARLDLEEGGALFPSADSLFAGKTAEQLQASLLAAANGDTLVTVAWGGDDPADANYTLLGAALVKVGGVQDSDTSNGRATVTIIDLVPPASG